MGTGLSLGIGIPFRRMGAGIDAQAQAHYDRVIADGGLIPSGLVGVNNFFTTVKAIYGTSDITTAISVGLDAQVLGYKLGAGAGTTAGQAAQKLYSCSGSSGDVEQTVASSQPLLLVHSGANYYQGVGVNLNFVSTPNAAANNFTGDIDIRVRYQPKNVSSPSQLLGKFNGSVYPYNFYQWTSKRFLFETNYGGVTSSSHTFNNDDIFWARVTRQASNGEIIFYTSVDGTNWTLLSTHTQTSGSLATGGDLTLFSGDPMVAKYYRVTLSNSIGGAPVVDFNPSQYNAANSQTQWVSTSGETWTINTGTAATGYKGALVSKTIVQGDGIDDRLTSNVIRTNILTQYLAANPFTNDNSGNSVLIDANNGAWLNSIVAFSSNIGNIMNSFASDLLRSRTPNRLILATSLNNEGVRNSISVNNGAETLNTYSPCPSGNGLNIFSRSGGGTFGNAIINTYISTIGQNNSTIRTAMYDYIRSINGSAF
jgi:hypothetical protein